MKILLVSNYLELQQWSMQKFAEMLSSGLKAAGHTVRVVRPPVVFGHIAPRGTGPAKWFGYIDRLLIFPLLLRWKSRWADIAHVCDQANAMYLPHLRCAKVITCHDLFAIRSALGLIEENPTRATGRVLQQWIMGNLRRAPSIVCVSKQTADELNGVLHVPLDKIEVIENALNFPYRKLSTEEAEPLLARMNFKSEPPFFLHVGNNSWYKNRMGVLKIFNELRKKPGFERYQLVCAGKPFTQEMQDYVRSNGLTQSVVERTAVTDRQLQALYSASAALLFPSLQEGFGWPIAEAQACGCLVVTTNRPPMSEISGGAAVLIDPESPAEAADQVARAWPKRDEMVMLGVVNASRFDIHAMTSGYVEVYRKALSRGDTRTSSKRARFSKPASRGDVPS